jgi:hypothetical protein
MMASYSSGKAKSYASNRIEAEKPIKKSKGVVLCGAWNDQSKDDTD